MMRLVDQKKIALVLNNIEISYKVLLKNINFYSSLIASKAPERIAVFSENRPEWIYSFFSAWKIGATVVPIDFMATAEEIAYILKDCNPQNIFCSNNNLKTLKEAIKNSGVSPDVIVFEDIKDNHKKFAAETLKDFCKEDVAVILYTSGTTGNPKGVMLTYDNLKSNVNAVSKSVKIFTREQRVMALLPYHHIFPLMGCLLIPLIAGSTIVFSPSIKAEDIMATLQQHKITIIIAVPRLYSAMSKNIKEKIEKSLIAKFLYFVAEKINSKNFSKIIFRQVHNKFGGNIKYLVSGGAALDIEVEKCFSTLGFELLVGYGMTETAPMMTFTRPGNVRFGACGQEVYQNTLKIKDGEVIARGNNVMKGYFNRPEETSDIIKDGWLHTGDLGYIDKDKFLFITGRKKEIIVLPSGKNINPEEIEFKIAGMTNSIKEIGVYMKNGIICALIHPDFAKLREKGIINIEEYFKWDVIDKFNRTVSSYKKIMKFDLIAEELPKTRIGKLKRFQLENFSKTIKEEKKKKEEPNTEEYQIIKQYLEKAIHKKVEIDNHLELDLGMDSLEKVSFQTFLQNSFGVALQDNELAKYSTVEEVLNFISSEKKKIEKDDFSWNEVLKKEISLELPATIFTYVLFKNMSRILLSTFFRVKIKGIENLSNSPFIIAANHQSFIDGLFVATYLPKNLFKKTYFFAKAKHVNNEYKQYLAMRNNVIVMDINKDLQASILKMAAVLRKKRNIIIFPEGTRTVDGNIGNFKKTFAILSKELNVPIVPTAIDGAFDVLPKGTHFPRLIKKISVSYLKPINPEKHNYTEISDIVKNSIEEALEN